ncbi:FAD-binding oxidoreductase [Leeia sp.]|uniref:FAD-binding oxidoreductase n=1 Tax=Leeia sp. TaxID=2884678 RepID=UPI0035ADED11
MSDLLAQLAHRIGDAHVLTAPQTIQPYLTDWRKRYRGKALAVLRPASTAEVAAIVRLCHDAGVSMVPQGGNTSLCGASVPDTRGDAVVISLSRLRQIRQVDPVNQTLTAEAGCTLVEVQVAAAQQQRLFPLSLASEGSCQIGGNLSTNAGGVQVLRYGNMRELTLGLEVVLPDGQIWDGLRGLRKDNTGYDLKHCFIGAEGTLGIITAATLKLFPRPQQQCTAWVALNGPEDALQLLGQLQQRFSDRLTAFELVSDVCLQLVTQHIPGSRSPLEAPSPWYALLELSDGAPDDRLAGDLLATLAESPVQDAAIAQSEQQARALWLLRESISEAQRLDGPSIKHDIALPVSAIPAFLQDTAALLQHAFPGVRLQVFGHLGDGNLHYNLSHTRPGNVDLFDDEAQANRIVYDQVAHYRGSISAEHGIGQLKRDTLPHYKSALELQLMLQLKASLDPKGLMNPGKVLV